MFHVVSPLKSHVGISALFSFFSASSHRSSAVKDVWLHGKGLRIDSQTILAIILSQESEKGSENMPLKTSIQCFFLILELFNFILDLFLNSFTAKFTPSSHQL